MKSYGKKSMMAGDDGIQEQLRDLLDAVSNEQPLPASGTELILLEIDPNRAHAYWNIDPAQAETPLPLVLRVYDITNASSTESAVQAFDVEVQGLQGRWYLDFWRDDRTFVAEIGYRQSDGSLKKLACSNEVRTPPSEPEQSLSDGKHVDHNGHPFHTDWPGDQQGELAAEEHVQELTEPADFSPESTLKPIVIEPVTLLHPEFPLSAWPTQITPPSTPFDTASAKSVPVGDAAMAAGDASVAFSDDELGEAAIGKSNESEHAGAAPLVEEFPSVSQLLASVTENHAALQAYYDAAGPEQPRDDEHAASADTSQPQHAHHDETPAQDHLPPLEQIVGLSSLEHRNQDVLLEVNAELHIYGRAKPNTELTLYGQVVKTRPDGSFSVRRPLPNGALILPLLYTRPEH